MCRSHHHSAAAILALLLATALWLPSIDHGRGAHRAAQSLLSTTYALPLAA